MHPLDDVYWGILYYMSYYFADYEQIGLYLPQYGYRRSAVHVQYVKENFGSYVLKTLI